MTSLFKEITALVEKIDYAILLEPEEGEWCEASCGISWQEGNDVYGGEVREGQTIQEGCVLINMDNGCGMSLTKVFLVEKELSEEEFEDKYGEFM